MPVHRVRHTRIESQLRKTSDLPVALECPSTADWKRQRLQLHRERRRRVEDEQSLRIVVSMENDEGEYTFYAE